MQVEVSTAISVGAAIFAAGGAWIIIKTTARSARLQGIRIGKLEVEVAELRGELGGRRRAKTAPLPVTSGE